MDDFDALQLVNIMWSFGKLNINPGTELVHRICDRLALLLVDLSPQVLKSCSQHRHLLCSLVIVSLQISGITSVRARVASIDG